VVKPFLKKKSCLLPFLGEKCKKCQQKAAKYLFTSYSTCPASKISNFYRFFWQLLILGKFQDGAQYGGHLE